MTGLDDKPAGVLTDNLTDVYVKVAVNAPINTPLTYKINIKDNTEDLIGTSVEVPLGARKSHGVVVGYAKQEDIGNFQIKEISSYPVRPVIPENFLKWLSWLSKYYLFPLGQIAETCFPPLAKKDKRKEVELSVAQEKPKLTDEQEKVVSELKKQNTFVTNLLFGVTGSGKTEVYMEIVEQNLRNGKTSLFIVPEISLTPQLFKRISKRFPGEVAMLHSGLTPREKTNEWWDIIDQKKKIILGARSALFCPVKELATIIVDEEHESSYKQESQLRYHARDAAIKLAQLHNCPVILGSATPSAESWKNAQEKKYNLLVMEKRVSDRSLPNIEVVDLRLEKKKQKENEGNSDLPFWMSELLFEGIKETIAKGEQVALFLNRRGVAQNIFCSSCGTNYECPNCTISLTLHGKKDLVCHYCDYHELLKDTCNSCGELGVAPLGLGTELLEEDMSRLFPELVIARADRDEIKNRHDLTELIEDFESRKINVLIGTQMISKGLDFPGLTLVGLVMSDVGLNMPDFRSSERNFQLITQVAGRCGRHSDEPGQVIIQSYQPKHKSITYACNHDVKGFLDEEIIERKEFDYAPYAKLGFFRINAKSDSIAEKTSQQLLARAEHLQSKYSQFKDIKVLGPSQAPLAKIGGRYRYQLLLKASSQAYLNSFCESLLGNKRWFKTGTKVQIDIDPYNMV